MTGCKKLKIAGWVLSVVISAFLIGASAMGKFTEWDKKEEMFSHLGYTTDVMFKIGILEVAIAVIYLIPRGGFLGVILLTGYLGGATATHVRVGDPFSHTAIPVFMGVLAWVAFRMRKPEVFSLLCGCNAAASCATPKPIA